MTYKIRFSSTAEKHFHKLKNKRLKERIASAIEYIAKNPLCGKPLQAELKGDRSFRVGDYRIIYHFYKKKKFIGIIGIGHRRDVYR